jgi:hypothetical protein
MAQTHDFKYLGHSGAFDAGFAPATSGSLHVCVLCGVLRLSYESLQKLQRKLLWFFPLYEKIETVTFLSPLRGKPVEPAWRIDPEPCYEAMQAPAPTPQPKPIPAPPPPPPAPPAPPQAAKAAPLPPDRNGEPVNCPQGHPMAYRLQRVGVCATCNHRSKVTLDKQRA